MSSLQFAVKFCMTFFILCLHFGLALLFILSLAVHSGNSTEGIAIGIEAILLFMVSIRLWQYYAQYRKTSTAQRTTRDRTSFDDWVFCVSTWLISLVNAIWITVHATALVDDFAGLPRPDFAAVAAIALVWLAWTCSLHLIWILVQEDSAWFDENQPAQKTVPWPSTPAAPFTPPPPRRQPATRLGRLSAKIVAVQHGSPPEMWAPKNKANPIREVSPMLQPAQPVYSPKSRPLRAPPPVITSRQQWYLTAGDIV